MNYPEDLCKLVIKNMDIIEAAPSITESVEKELFAIINARIEERVKQQENWKGCFDLVTDIDDEETTFAPTDWPEAAKGYLAFYSMIDTCDNLGWLSHATGAQGAALALGFRLSQDHYNMKATAYKTTLANFYNSNATIKAASFELSINKYWIFRPFTFDAEKLAAEYPDFDEALAPLDAALDDLFSVHKEFDTFVKNLGNPNVSA